MKHSIHFSEKKKIHSNRKSPSRDIAGLEQLINDPEVKRLLYGTKIKVLLQDNIIYHAGVLRKVIILWPSLKITLFAIGYTCNYTVT